MKAMFGEGGAGRDDSGATAGGDVPPVVVARVTQPLRRVPSLDVSFRTVTSVSHIFKKRRSAAVKRGFPLGTGNLLCCHVVL